MDPQEFFRTLWGDPPPGVINVFRLPDRKSSWHRIISGINEILSQYAHEEVYTGVSLADQQKGRFTTHNRIEEAAAGAIAGVWADIDVFHEVHAKAERLPGTREEAQEVMAKLPYEPTLIIDSGHGLQYWWLLRTPWVFQDEDEWGEARRMVQWWHHETGELFDARGWTTDSVYDLSRILRIPGTFNNKVKDDPKEVVAIKTGGPRYDREDFLKLVPEEFVATAPAPEQRRGRRGRAAYEASATTSGLILDPKAEPNAVRLAALLKADRKFQQSWDRNRPDLKDQSASSYNMSLADIAVRANWPDQEVVNLMICWRRMHGCDLKLRERYYEITLARAKEPIEMEGDNSKLGEVLTEQERGNASINVDPKSQASHGDEPEAEPGFDANKHRPMIALTQDEGRNIEVCLRAVKLLNNPPRLFSISDGEGVGVLSGTPGALRMDYCDADRTHLEITRRVQFTRVNRKGISTPATPSVTLMKLLHRALPPEVPPFNGFKRMPFLWEGSLVTTSGYHSESGYYADIPPGLDFSLTVESALAIIDEFFGGFPYQEPADRANAYSVILGFPIKPLGNAPGLFADKPTSQTGASLLCRCLSWVITGKRPVLVTQGKSIGELDKRLITKLKSQEDVIILDNLNGLLESDMVASGMTDDWFGSRLLNLNKDAQVPTRALGLMFTGNNLTATRELQNRCLRCRLDANHPRPETRTDFRHRLPGDVVTHRVEIVSAVSSIVQRWIDNGMPLGSPFLGSFIPYTEALSGLLTFAGMPELDGNRGAMVQETTPFWDNLETLILRWWETHGAEPVAAVDLLDQAEGIDLKGETDRARSASLSQRLGRDMDRVFEVADGVYVKLVAHGRDKRGRAKKGLRYTLISVQPADGPSPEE